MSKFRKIVICLILVITFTVLMGFMAESESSAAGDLAANKEILRRALDEFWNQRDVGAIDELYSTDYSGHDPNGLHGATLEEFKHMSMYDKWRELNIEGVYRQVDLHRRGN